MTVTTNEERIVIVHADYRREFLGAGEHEVTREEFEKHLADTGLFTVKETENV